MARFLAHATASRESVMLTQQLFYDVLHPLQPQRHTVSEAHAQYRALFSPTAALRRRPPSRWKSSCSTQLIRLGSLHTPLSSLYAPRRGAAGSRPSRSSPPCSRRPLPASPPDTTSNGCRLHTTPSSPTTAPTRQNNRQAPDKAVCCTQSSPLRQKTPHKQTLRKPTLSTQKTHAS